VAHAVEFLVQDEKARVFLTCMVSCLFAREVYKETVLADCLNAVGYRNLAEIWTPWPGGYRTCAGKCG